MSKDVSFFKVSSAFLIFLGGFFSASILAATQTSSSYMPYVYLNGYGGNGAGNFLGRADFLMPVYTNENKNLFIYGQGMYGDELESDLSNVWSLSGGLGYRQIVGSRLYGAYILTDYNSTTNDNPYWMISPGIETLGEIVDFRMNGYFPMSDTKWTSDKSPVYLQHTSDHDVYQIDSYTESVGPGGDAEIGAKVLSISHMPVKVFLNGYYFSPRDEDSILGIGGRITFQPTRYLTLEVRDSYDDENHNVIMAGARICLNGFVYGLGSTHVDDIGIQPRLYDQIERNLEAAGVGTTAMSRFKETSTRTDESDYYTVYVINGEGATSATTGEIAGSGTLEDPYIYADEDDMQVVLDNTEAKYGAAPVRIYFTSPNDTPFYMPQYVDSSSYVDVYSNQQLWGTTGNDWAVPSTPDTYAVDLVGGFSLTNDTGTEFHYLKIDNYNNAGYPDAIPGSPFPTAINITNSQDILLQSVEIGNPTLLYGTGFGTGIDMKNYSSLALDDTKVYGSGNKGAITITDGGDLVAINNTHVESTAYGINLLPDSDGNIIMGDFIGDTTSEYVGYTSGLYAYNSATGMVSIGDINGSSFFGGSNYTGAAAFTVTSNGKVEIGNINDSVFQGTTGFRVYDYSTNVSNYVHIGNVTNSKFIGYFNYAFAVESSVDVTIKNIVNSFINEAYSNVIGLYVSGQSTANIYIGNIINSIFQGNSYSAVYIYSNKTITVGDISGSSFISASAAGLYFGGTYTSLSIGGTPYTTNAQDVYNYLIDQDNTFNTVANRRVCLKNNSCY